MPARDAIRGVGLGLRARHYADILEQRPAVPWFEALTDNYLGEGGPPLRNLEAIRTHYPIVFHGVGLSLGGTDPLDTHYLQRLERALARFEPAWLSDHLCFTGAGGRQTHELLPLPQTEEAVIHCADRIARVQDRLGRRILVENVSRYVEWRDSAMSEWDFISAVCERADCDLLLDVNNIHVSATNLGFDPVSYLDGLPVERVRQMHLAGYSEQGTHLLDDHGSPVQQPVWALYRHAIARFGAVPTLIEWDQNVPEFATLLAEAERARQIMDSHDARAG